MLSILTMNKLTEVYTEWQNNSEFRNAFSNNPETALKNAGIELSPEDLNKVKSMLLKNSQNGKLDDRISK